jgi:hypothetical protein
MTFSPNVKERGTRNKRGGALKIKKTPTLKHSKPIKACFSHSSKLIHSQAHKNTTERVRDERMIRTEQDKGGCTPTV